MPSPQYKAPVRGDYIHGEFLTHGDLHSGANGEWVSRSPADSADELGRFFYSFGSIDQAVSSAREAFKSWRGLKPETRAEYLKKYKAALKSREQDFVEVLAREVGKPLWEAQSEFASMINKVDITLQESPRFTADFEIAGIMEGALGACRYRPHGVMAVLGPFNFPGHLPNGHIVPALLTGNTVVFKPSEKTPMIGQIIAEVFHEASFPKGVFNLVQGERELGRRLVTHEGVDGVLFTGSYEVGTRIRQDTLLQHWKLLALEMGGKNASIIFSDADLAFALYESLVGAFITAGQRCSATSRILVERTVFDSFVARFHDRSKAFSIGHPLENPFMGPLIEQGAVDRYMKFMGIASREGCEIVMRGKTLEHPQSGNYVTPSICVVKDTSLEALKKSVYQQTELFAPNVAIIPFDDVEEAVALANGTQYGLVASVFTSDRVKYQKCWDGLRMGLVNWNKSTVGASSRLPFGGLKKSGNHMPTAVTANLYCTFPVSSIEVAEPKIGAVAPGLNWS